jgi:hypothetical protein
MRVAERAEKPEEILAGIRKSEAGDRDLAVQRSEASSRKLTLFAMRICLTPRCQQGLPA